MSAFPPHHAHPSMPVSAAIALQKLQAYLAATQTTPYLLPNATLQSDGPRAASDSSSNLVIHNLKRVEAGLRGEWLAPSLELENEGLQAGLVPIAGLKRAAANGSGEGITDIDGFEEEDGEGWQDLDEYRREQSIDEGEIGERHTAIGQEGNEAIHPGLEVADEAMTEEMKKMLRKEAKRLRRKKEKKERVYKGK